MKLNGNYKEWSVSQSLLGKILEVSQPRINQLIEEEIVLRDESSTSGAVLLIDSLKNYYLSKQSANDEGGGSINFWREKGLHERAKRELAELKLRERRGELYESATVEKVIIEMLTEFRTKLLGIPAKLSARLEGKKRGEIYDAINFEIENSLEELSTNLTQTNYRYEDYDDKLDYED